MGGQDFLQVFSYFLANVSDLAHPWAYRLRCHNCMSPYLEDQFKYIEHLYRRPIVFTEKCDHGQFDWRYVPSKNCTDACVTLRMNDRVGGRRRFGFMRGCLSDIIRHNRTAVRFGELSRTTKSGAAICTAIRLRDLFVSSERYGFDPHDHVDLCACIRPNCNWATASKGGPNNALLALAFAAILALVCLFPQSNCDWREALEVGEIGEPVGTRRDDSLVGLRPGMEKVHRMVLREDIAVGGRNYAFWCQPEMDKLIEYDQKQYQRERGDEIGEMKRHWWRKVLWGIDLPEMAGTAMRAQSEIEPEVGPAGGTIPIRPRICSQSTRHPKTAHFTQNLYK